MLELFIYFFTIGNYWRHFLYIFFIFIFANNGRWWKNCYIFM